MTHLACVGNVMPISKSLDIVWQDTYQWNTHFYVVGKRVSVTYLYVKHTYLRHRG